MAENWGIIGHEWAVDLLRRSIETDRIAHAYLISGPAEVGKALLALRLAQALNCEEEQSAPCLHCRTCGRIARGNYPDIRIAGMASQGAALKAEEAARQRDLKIDTIREWQADITLRPYEGKRRVFILHDAERMSEAAANAMLKTLEEPPPYATILLVANTAGDLLPTIVSRCQPLKLRPVSPVMLSNELTKRYQVQAKDADLLAAWSRGRPGWAIRMINNPEELEARQNQIDELANLSKLPQHERFRWAEEQAKLFRGGEQASVYQTLELWQAWWRDILLVAANAGEAITHVDRRIELQQIAKNYQIANLHAYLKRINAASQQLRENTNPQLVIENVLLHLP